MHIWLISLFEQTPVDNVFSTRFISIADIAQKRGHQVSFFASTFKHNTKNQRFDTTTEVVLNDKYKMLFVKSLPYKKNVSLRRLYAHYQFSKKLPVHLNAAPRPDVIFIALPAVSVAYAVTKWAQVRGIPVIIDIIDPWPDIFRKALRRFPKKIQDTFLYSMRQQVKKIFTRAAAVSAISNEYIDWAKTYHSNIAFTKCFYPAADLHEMQAQLQEAAKFEKKRENVFQIIYAGSLASSYDVPGILEAAAILEKKYPGKIEFVIAGAGPQQSLVEKYIRQHTNLRYVGRLGKAALMREYFLSDIGLTQHVKGASQSVTYKLFDLLACGLPIMNSLDSEMKHIILENKVGLFNEPGDAVMLAGNIEFCYNNPDEYNAMKSRATALTAKLGDAKIVYNEAVDFIEAAAANRLQ